MAKATTTIEFAKKTLSFNLFNDESILSLLKSMDRLAKENNLFRCFCGQD